MDSAAAVRNMYNQGGKIPELIMMYKAWMALCLEHNIDAYFCWIPREENGEADGLSKQVPLEWALTQDTLTLIKSVFGKSVRVHLPNLNQLNNFLDNLARDGGEEVVIHPVWPACSWWTKLRSACVQMLALPEARESLVSAVGGRPGPHAWKMQASRVVFRTDFSAQYCDDPFA